MRREFFFVICGFGRRQKKKLHFGKEAMSECPICFHSYPAGDLTVLWPCQHTFCSDCLHKQLKRDGRCAICRFPFCETTPPLFYDVSEKEGEEKDEGGKKGEKKGKKRKDEDEIRSITLVRQTSGMFGVSIRNIGSHDKVVFGTVSWRHLFRQGLTSGTEIVAANTIPCYSATALLHLLSMKQLSQVVLHVRRDRYLDRYVECLQRVQRLM